MTRCISIARIIAIAALALTLNPFTRSGFASDASEIQIKTLSARADLVSGGDALVEIVIPPGADLSLLRVDVDGRDISAAFERRASGRVMGLVTALANGLNTLSAQLLGKTGARLTLVNHPIGGPVFSGPQVQPWLCETQAAGLGAALDAQCNAPTRVEFLYRSALTGAFMPYSSGTPAWDVAMTTTDEGHQVPYIVRRETGTLNRGIYRVAILYNPAQPWQPWAPQAGWNRKVFYPFEGGAAPNHRQGSAPSEVLRHEALSRGFAVASATLNVFGQNVNAVTSAETMMMVKERIIERFGEIRYTISAGGSGGSVQQHMIANSYPGLLDGIIPDGSFPDYLTPIGPYAADCMLLSRYFNEISPLLWLLDSQRAAVTGHSSWSSCLLVTDGTGLASMAWDPRIGCMNSMSPLGLMLVPEPAYVYDPQTNPAGVRCTMQDYLAAVYGSRPPQSWGSIEQQIRRGFAPRPYDNVGVQYGLKALNSGKISLLQFLDLNEKIGGHDIDFRRQTHRSQADPGAAATAYRTGQITIGRQLARVPIIDLRASTQSLEFHNDFHSLSMRARLSNANGHADNQLLWKGPATMALDDTVRTEAFLLMDRWLAAIEADSSDLPLESKVVQDRPSEAEDLCRLVGPITAPDIVCDTLLPVYEDPRLVAGAPRANDIVKCELRPLNRDDYNVVFTSSQWSRLQSIFPTGVCDYSRPSVGYTQNIPWLSYEQGPGGQALGPAPVSEPF